MTEKYYHVRVNDETRKSFQSAVPWGYQGAVMEELMNLFVDLVREYGELISVAVLLEKRAKITVKEHKDAAS